MTETYLETESSVSHAEPRIAAHLLSSIAQTIEEAPDGKRYTVTIEVEEHDES